jgi:hypothetical protein
MQKNGGQHFVRRFRFQFSTALEKFQRGISDFHQGWRKR